MTPSRSTLAFRSLRETCVRMLAAIATRACGLQIAPGPGLPCCRWCCAFRFRAAGPNDIDLDRIEAAVALPIVGLVVVFVAGIFLSIWLRRFEAIAWRAGSLIALPFVALLVTCYVPATDNRIPALLVPVIITTSCVVDPEVIVASTPLNVTRSQTT